MKPTAPLKFAPRFLPRNAIDCGLNLLAVIVGVPLTIFLMGIAIWIIIEVARLLTGHQGAAWAAIYSWNILSMALLAYCAAMPVLRVEFTEEGIRVVRPLQKLTVPWDAIERVEELSPVECARIACRADFFTGKMACPGTLTFTDYVLIHHADGSILFPPRNKEIFLHELRKYRERRQAEQTQEAAKTSPWYWTASALREENQQTLRSRSGE